MTEDTIAASSRLASLALAEHAVMTETHLPIVANDIEVC